jgi:acetyltransferase-like isoleucine patch superfamily enzyme
MKQFSSHGTGEFDVTELGTAGANVILERGVRVFHPESVHLGDNVYVGHDTILKGYYRGIGMHIGADTWIGQQCFFHSAGGLHIGNTVGIGPGVRIITSTHVDPGSERPIMDGPIEFRPVTIGNGSDLGVGCTVLPGVTIGRGVQVGAGAVVASDLPDYAVAAGVPARIIRFRDGREVGA